jgi:hypothetical protein
MTIPGHKGRVTRRGFLELSSRALASVGMLAAVGDVKAALNTGEVRI